MNMNGTAAQGFFSKVQDWINNLFAKLQINKQTLMEIGLYLGLGFIVGFLLRKFSTYVFMVVLFIIGLYVAQYYNLIDVAINWKQVQATFGIKQTSLDASMMVVYWEWFKLNFVIVISFAIGFLFGIKLG